MKLSLRLRRILGPRKVTVAIFNGTHEANGKLQESQERLRVWLTRPVELAHQMSAFIEPSYQPGGEAWRPAVERENSGERLQAGNKPPIRRSLLLASHRSAAGLLLASHRIEPAEANNWLKKWMFGKAPWH